MAIQTITYAAKTAIAITSGASLANAAGCQSASVTNSANKFDDALVQAEATGSAAGNTGTVDFYVATALGDTSFSDAATGTDSAFTAANRKNSVWLGSLTMNGATLVRGMLQRSVAAAFGGVMPERWTIIAINNSGAVLAAGGITLNYAGITYTVA